MRIPPLRGAGNTRAGMEQMTPSPVDLSVRLPDSPLPPNGPANDLPNDLPNGLPNGKRNSLVRTGDYATVAETTPVPSSTEPGPGYMRRPSLTVSPSPGRQDLLDHSSLTHFPPSPSPSSQPQPLPHHLPHRPEHPPRPVPPRPRPRPRPRISRSPSSRATPTPTPLPYAKLLPLLISRISEGLIYSVIFPYINEMVHSFGIREKDVGVWSAMAESALMVCEAFTAPLYAPLADRLGRRPVLLVCLLFWGFFAVCFGLVQSVWATVVMRGTLGLLAGAGVITRTMCGELCDKTNRIQGFAVFSPSITIGVTLGPLVGGFLANPVPRLLPPSWTLFERYPYLLPAIVSGSTGVLAFVSGLFLTPETLPPSMRREQGHRDAEKGSRAGVRGLLSYKPYQNVLILYGLNNAVMFSWEAVFPLFAFTRKELGGLELSTRMIGVVLALSAVLSIFMTAVVFPMLHRALPESLYLKLCLLAYPLAVLFCPVLWGLHRADTGSLGVAAWAVLVAQMIIRRTGDFAATMLDAMVLDSIPGPEHLALANSLTFSVAAVGRAIGPFIISWFFSLSTSFSSPWSPGRQLVWIVFILLCLPSIYLAYRMEADRPPQPWSDEEEEDEERHELIERRSDSEESEHEFEHEHVGQLEPRRRDSS